MLSLIVIISEEMFLMGIALDQKKWEVKTIEWEVWDKTS